MAMNRVEVTIHSRQYAVLAEESEEYLKKLAEHIDEKVRLVLKGGQNVMGERPMVLAALNVCDEYYKCEEAGNLLKQQLAAYTKKLEAANDEIRQLKNNEPQISFDEQEAEAKLRTAEDRLLETQNRLKAAEEKISALEARINTNNAHNNKYGKKH